MDSIPDPKTLLQCQNLLHDWAESMDTKSWTRLQSILAPTISIDYTAVGREKDSAVPSTSFLRRISSPTQLGNTDIQTQHFVGACKWTSVSEKRVRVVFQVRAAHRRVKQGRHGEDVVVVANAHGVDTMEFEEVDGVWKIVGIKVEARWVEGDFEGIFRSKL